jgi:hypothetical protein
MEARFGALEKALESTKVGAVLLYAGLVEARMDKINTELQSRADTNPPPDLSQRFAHIWMMAERISSERARPDARHVVATNNSSAFLGGRRPSVLPAK